MTLPPTGEASISDDPRGYTEQEFALILRKASELADAPTSGERSAGFSLEEIKAVAAEVGLDPALVERAAGLLPRTPRQSGFERLLGGPVKYRLEHSLPVELSEERIALVVSAIRAAAEHHGEVETNVAGLAWKTTGEPSQVYVTANRGRHGTQIRVTADRGPGMLLTGFFNLMAGVVIAAITGAVLEPESAAVGAAIMASGVIGGLSMARAVWTSTTRSMRVRLDSIMDAVTRALADPGDGADL